MRDRKELGVDVDQETDPVEIIEDVKGEEISGAIAQMKRGKVTGDYDLPVKVLKEAGKEAQKLFLTIMHHTCRQVTVPPE